MNRLYQVSTLNALMLGNFDSADTIAHVLSMGNFGIGTFTGMDGEMIVCDGTAYRAAASGRVQPAELSETTPFCIVGKDDPSVSFENCPQPIPSFEALKALWDEKIDALGGNKNCFYLMHSHGVFPFMHIRSIAKQQKPYLTLPQVASSQQEHLYEAIRGNVVGVWFPAYCSGINMPGWHLHFLSEDRSCGGHILELSASELAWKLLPKTDFALHLPTNPEFACLPLDRDLSRETKSVEGESQKNK